MTFFLAPALFPVLKIAAHLAKMEPWTLAVIVLVLICLGWLKDELKVLISIFPNLKPVTKKTQALVENVVR